jgi:hypothetical protein
MPYRRPRSLAEAARNAEREGDIYGRVREFLDHFYRHPAERKAMIAAEPPLMADEVANAYLGAVAEHLATRYRLGVPSWVHHSSRFLKRPSFAGPAGLKAMLLVESPTAFRRRMIFVGFDPLARPSRRGKRPVPLPWGASNGMEMQR